MRLCKTCNEEKQESEFYSRTDPTGYTYTNRSCRTCTQEAARVARGNDGFKTCNTCHEYKPISDFPYTMNGPTRYYRTRCKSCGTKLKIDVKDDTINLDRLRMLYGKRTIKCGQCNKEIELNIEPKEKLIQENRIFMISCTCGKISRLSKEVVLA